MSILIKGMEMPKKQVYVILNQNGLVEVLDANNVLLEEYQAVPVPPHGSLIDADALCKDGCGNCYGCPYDVCIITNASTIIPAEEGE